MRIRFFLPVASLLFASTYAAETAQPLPLSAETLRAAKPCILFVDKKLSEFPREFKLFRYNGDSTWTIELPERYAAVAPKPIRVGSDEMFLPIIESDGYTHTNNAFMGFQTNPVSGVLTIRRVNQLQMASNWSCVQSAITLMAPPSVDTEPHK